MEQKPSDKIFLSHQQISELCVNAFRFDYKQDPWGFIRPGFSKDLALLSAELSLSAYDFEMEQWAQAGWVDFTFQVENKVYSVDNSVFLDEVGENEKEDMKTLGKAIAQTRQSGLTKELRGAVRQRESSDTGKVSLMGKKIDHEKYVIAIGFMGTGARAYDWLSNFRFELDEGAHRGFMQLTRHYMSHSTEIYFPEIAQELGLQNLTLFDIINECTKAESRFLLWMSGHSQGAAMMQLWAYLLVKEKKVRLSHIIGYGFASPLVMMGSVSDHPGKYPLYHILNSEDLVQRVGGQVRLGVDRPYIVTDALINKSYGWRKDAQAAKGRECVAQWLSQMVDMPTALEILTAYFQVFFDGGDEEVAGRIRLLPLPFASSKMLTGILQKRTAGLLRFLVRRIERAYQNLTGVSFNKERIDDLKKALSKITQEITFEQAVLALNEILYWPHVLYPKEQTGTSSYLEIVKNSDRLFVQSIWEKGSPPKRKWALAADKGLHLADEDQKKID